MESVMIKLGDVTVGYTVLIVLLVIILIVASVRVVATFNILNRGHTCSKHVRGEHEEMAVIQ
jgi:hypothetical protein